MDLSDTLGDSSQSGRTRRRLPDAEGEEYYLDFDAMQIAELDGSTDGAAVGKLRCVKIVETPASSSVQLTSSVAVWRWDTGKGKKNRWRPFDQKSNQIIEHAFNANHNDIDVRIEETPYKVVLEAGENREGYQRNTDTKTERSIKRQKLW